MRSKVKITVVKLLTAQEVYGEALPATPDESLVMPCPRFKKGDEFIVPEDGSCPPGFCGWAYADIQRDITHLRLGGDFPWVKEKGVTLACCTDAFRPVFFRLERVE